MSNITAKIAGLCINEFANPNKGSLVQKLHSNFFLQEVSGIKAFLQEKSVVFRNKRVSEGYHNLFKWIFTGELSTVSTGFSTAKKP